MQVLHADAPAGARQQAKQLVSGAGVVDDRQCAHQVGDLGLDEKPADAEHVERHPALAQRIEEEALCLAGAQQQRGRGRFAAAVSPLTDASGEPVGHDIRFIENRLGEHCRDRALARVRRRTQGLDPDARARRERLDDPVRDVEAGRRCASWSPSKSGIAGIEAPGELLEVAALAPRQP